MMFGTPEAGISALDARPAICERSVMRVRGQFSPNYPRTSYRPEIQNSRGSHRDVSLADMPAEATSPY